MHVVELSLPPDVRSVASARRAARQALADWDADAFEWALSQLLTEVATNAVIHAATSFQVSIALDGDRLRCEVRDGSPRVPRRRRYSADATTGRGLSLIDQLAASWGVTVLAGGKTVWFELADSGSGGGLEADLDAFLAADELAGTGAVDSGEGQRPAAGAPAAAMCWLARAA